MSAEKEMALRRRIVPSVPLTLNLDDDSGSKLTRVLRLSFDFNAIARIEDMTGISVLRGEIWAKINARNLGIILWAASLAHHPDYDSGEGLVVVQSFIDAGNFEEVILAILDAYIVSLPDSQKGIFEDIRKGVAKATSENPTKGPGLEIPKA